MKCRNCGKQIEENQIFCSDCKKNLRESSSREEVRELEELTREQINLNELEQTKPLDNLDNLVEEELNKELVLETQKLEENVENTDSVDEKVNTEEVNSVVNKKSNKKLIIVLVSVGSVLVLGLIILFVFLLLKNLNNKTKPENDKNETTINYEKVIKDYGKSLESIVLDYISKNNEVPTWQQVSDLINYNDYEVVCETHSIYNDGSIYLSSCKVNDKDTEYSYGEFKEEIKEGKKIEIYKLNYGDDYYVYTDRRSNGSTIAGEITCETMTCKYINAYDKYVLIEDNYKYYLYNYDSNTIEFGPFTMYDEYSYTTDLLSYYNTLYGVYYTENNVKNIYNVITGKTLKNLKGNLLSDDMGFEPSIMYKYDYAIFENNNKYDFVNLKTGNVSYSIDSNISSFIEDTKNNIVYMTSYDNDYQSFKLYNSNGKLLFDGKKFNKVNVGDGNLIVSSDTTYQVYDSKLRLKTSSKEYDEVLGLYDDFIVVLDNNHLEILDINDNILATFEDEWDSDRFYFHSMISGWYTDNGKYGIYLVVEDREIPYGTMGSGLEYYYIPTTKEIGVIETIGVGGYAKPVLYLYPEDKTNITVTFKNTDLLTTTYPKFKNNWSVTAYPNGDLYDKNGNYYYALYWEEEKNHNVDFTEGFYVTKDSAIEFLEEKLSIIGLNDKERNEFIMYWLPILEKNQKSLVYFELTEERDSYNKLIINPKPDSLLRVAIHVKKVNKKTSIKEQKLTSFARNGFTAVEWGGVIY